MSYSKKIAFIFPGQGDQYVGMGKDFYDDFSVARECFQEADDLLEKELSTIVFNGPMEILTETANSQVGIYVTSISILKVLQNLYPDLKPTVTSGLSLGEYSALTAANKITFQNCLPLVQKRGMFMNEACESTEGTMAAILGMKSEKIIEVVNSLNLPNDLWIANFNSPGQTVISGTKKGIDAGIKAFQEKGAKRTVPLQVHGAFHSGLMKEAEERLAPFVHEVPLAKSDINIVMNVPGDLVSDESMIRKNLIEQVTHSVCWEQGVAKMNGMGVDLFVSIGCGKTLQALNRRNGVKVPTLALDSVKDLDKVEETLSNL